jgi:cytochrome c
LHGNSGQLKTGTKLRILGLAWRIQVDQKTGYVYWGEVGPDAHGNGARGPRGYDEVNQARSAGNFGWPYFIGNNFAYADVDFATGTVGEQYVVDSPRNESPNNTALAPGLENLKAPSVFRNA